jgi:hypothetical protein
MAYDLLLLEVRYAQPENQLPKNGADIYFPRLTEEWYPAHNKSVPGPTGNF